MQTIVVIYYQHFGTTYQPHLFFFGFLTLEGGTDNLSQNVGKELSLLTV